MGGDPIAAVSLRERPERRISRTMASISQHLAETAATKSYGGRAASEPPGAD
jgi:hypothetical protein